MDEKLKQILKTDGSNLLQHLLMKMQFSRTVRTKDFRIFESLNKGLVWEFRLWKNIILRDVFYYKWSLLTELVFCAQKKKGSVNGIQILHNRWTSEFHLRRLNLNNIALALVLLQHDWSVVSMSKFCQFECPNIWLSFTQPFSIQFNFQITTKFYVF